MHTLATRIGRIERAAELLAGAGCTLCRGYPMAAVLTMFEADPDGPGVRLTGDFFLTDGDAERFTEDLCCRACGREAEVCSILRPAEAIDLAAQGGVTRCRAVRGLN
jgi:hypothetical protein